MGRVSRRLILGLPAGAAVGIFGLEPALEHGPDRTDEHQPDRTDDEQRDEDRDGADHVRNPRAREEVSPQSRGIGPDLDLDLGAARQRGNLHG